MTLAIVSATVLAPIAAQMAARWISATPPSLDGRNMQQPASVPYPKTLGPMI
jgi:hypothetical protein